MPEDKIKIGISACLLGEKVRYDGKHSLDHYLKYTLGRYIQWIPVCPEVECGLPVPREPMHLIGSPENPRLITKYTGVDYTDLMNRWIKKKLRELQKEGLCGFVFKSRSPSSGLMKVKIKEPDGRVRMGRGLFARAFVERFPELPVEDDQRLQNPDLRKNFFLRVYVYKRWKELIKRNNKKTALVKFHERHKLILMAHSLQRLREMETLLSSTDLSHKKLINKYFLLLMETLKLRSTMKKNYAVLQHILRHLRQALSIDETDELRESFEDYKRGRVPLIVPVTLINHYARKYNISYIEDQYYLRAFPENFTLD
ncbi:MAG: DUF523 and DUF1722 domain-containing protein [Nitrospirae bacterium]|nr:DUF523 and DUF1722 domain-containing protein [Nitrospirota bacterium]